MSERTKNILAWIIISAVIFMFFELGIAHAGDLPDPQLTPGAASPVTLAEICPHAHTALIRPPASYTNKLKRQQLATTYTANDPYAEEDHLISLELGGDPRDQKNLWPQPWNSKDGNGAKKKDKLEDKLHSLVCNGTMTIEAAQACISTDWIACYREVFK